MENDTITKHQIGDIGNYYGGLWVKQQGEKFYWAVENYSGFDWEEIPQYLYDTLNRFNDTDPTKEPTQ